MIMKTCPHFNLLPWAKMPAEATVDDEGLLMRLFKGIEGQKNCQTCEKQTRPNYICLNPDCFYIGCGRDDKSHALDHFRRFHKPKDGDFHSVFLNCNAFQCWCYDCDDAIVPPIFTSLEALTMTGNNEDGADSISSNGSISKKKSTRSSMLQYPVGVAGLYNLGNSCYMNAAIQALLNCPSLMGYFQRCASFIYRHNNRQITESFHKLVETILTSNMQVVSPSRLVREVKLINPMFHGYTQQDTMDFVRCVLERIHDEMKTSTKSCQQNKEKTLEDINSNVSRRRSGRLARQDSLLGNNGARARDPQQYRSVISDTFGGILRSEIVCSQCKNVSVKDDPFYDVSIQISAAPDGPKYQKPSSFGYIGKLFSTLGESMGINGKPVKLETCLASFCAPETLEGKDKYRCEKCNDLVSSRKTLKFKELPQVMCLQLKRFRHESYFSSKISTHVIFPVDNLDVTPYLHEAASEQSKQETRYYLSAMISHRGTFSGGHYVAYCKNQVTGRWLEFDDSTVTCVSEEDVSRTQAYTLFYTLVDWNSRKEREELLPKIQQFITDLNSTDDDGETDDIDSGVYISRYWYNEWCTLADPGPLDNSEVACPHGQLPPEKLVDPAELVQRIPSNVYELLVQRHGEVSGFTPMTEAIVCGKCLEEKKELASRRIREERDIQALDTSTIRPGEYWHLISSEWLVNWGQFKSGNCPPPGPISNDLLIPPTSPNNTPRLNLTRGTHYRGVNRRVWDYFYRIYGGGPTIVRKSINIYGPQPEDRGLDCESGPEDVYVDVVGH